MKDLLNPYIAGAPVVESDMFFGRRDVFDWIERSLRGKYVDHILVIHGQRRVGKTSILKQIPSFLPENYLQVFFDLQGRTNTSPGRFLWWLTREIARTLKRRHGITVSAPDRAAITGIQETMFTHFLPEITAMMGDRALLLTFDEFDTLNQPTIQEQLAIPLIQTLRRMMELEGVSFVFSIGSSGQKLENMRTTYTELFKSALYKKISFLEPEDCFELIVRPVEGVLSYDEEAVQRIYQVTAGHPYFTQLVCHELFSVCQKTGVRGIGRADVDSVLLNVIERGTVNLKFVWDEASTLEKWTLACLARSPECSDPDRLANTLKDQRLRYSKADLHAALVHLQEKDVLTANNRFMVELLRLWLRQNRPFERVREELVEVSPIANRYIEIGEEYWDQGKRQIAIESFRQALEVDPGNVKARVSVGTLLLEADEYESAASAFESALALDEEDVTALRGYCEARLALGSQSLDEAHTAEAIDHYEAVLKINPEHQVARQKLATIYQQRAQEKMAIGQDEDALLAFQTALGYTPENEALAEVVKGVMDEKQAEVIARLTVRAERAQREGNWEAAISALQDALTLSEEDVALQKKMAGVKESHRVHLLATLPAHARELEGAEEWKKAIQTWEQYLGLYPTDQRAAHDALENAMRMSELQDQYRNARTSLQSKDYKQAIALLRKIIQVDPGYRNASRLLATAVEADHRDTAITSKWPRYALPAMVLLIVAALFLGLRSAGRLPGFNIQRKDETPSLSEVPVVEGSSLATETAPAPSPTFSLTPPAPPTQDLAWMASFADPILDSIDDRSPDFEEDFSAVEAGWNVHGWSLDKITNGKALERVQIADYVQDGALKLQFDSHTDFALQGAHFDNARDFVLQYDILTDSSHELWVNFTKHLSFNFDYALSDYSWRMGDNTDRDRFGQGIISTFEDGQPNQVVMIASERQMAVFVNDHPLTHFQGIPEHPVENQFTFIQRGDPSQFTLDNVKFWRLDTDPANDGSEVCQSIRRVQLKWDPDPDAGGALSNFTSIGDSATVVTKTIGTDGQTWYRIILDASGNGGWVPEYALSQACRE
jgi:tetratricopeptide (TPR) repeat protein